MEAIKLSENMKEIEIEKKETDFEEFEDDFDLEETRPTYEVWLHGTDENNFVTDFEYLVEDGYNSPVEAKKCFDFFSVEENLKLLDQLVIPEEVKHLYISVEAVVEEGPDMMVCLEALYETEIILKK